MAPAPAATPAPPGEGGTFADYERAFAAATTRDEIDRLMWASGWRPGNTEARYRQLGEMAERRWMQLPP